MALACVARGQVLLDNLAEVTRGATTLGDLKGGADWSYAAQGFGTQGVCAMVSIEVLAGNGASPGVFAQLRGGADPTAPALATFSVPEIPEGGLEVVMLTPDTSVLLQPGETYWLVIGGTSGTFQWAYAEGNVFEGPGYFANYWYSNDDAEWFDFGGDNPYQMRVNVKAVLCSADFNADGTVNSADFFDFLTAFFTEDPRADFNLDASVNSQDFFDYLSAFFGGC
jgi:hypothetical protein